MIAVVGLVAAVLGFITAVIALDPVMGGFWPVVTLVGALVFALAAGIAVIGRSPAHASRADGVRDQLEGLRLFIRLAEADRIRVLQSPSGPARSVGVVSAAARLRGPPALDPVEMLRLTERLLPSAALFGLEKELAA